MTKHLRNYLLLLLSLQLFVGVFYFNNSNNDKLSAIVIEEVEWETESHTFLPSSFSELLINKNMSFYWSDNVLKFFNEVIYSYLSQDVETPPPEVVMV